MSVAIDSVGGAMIKAHGVEQHAVEAREMVLLDIVTKLAVELANAPHAVLREQREVRGI